jgi:hypothetical protein
MWLRFAFLAMVVCACATPAVVWAQANAAAKAPAAKPASSSLGEWAAPVNFCTYPCLVGSNAAVLNNGNVLFYHPAAGQENSQAMVLNPITGVITDVAAPRSGYPKTEAGSLRQAQGRLSPGLAPGSE